MPLLLFFYFLKKPNSKSFRILSGRPSSFSITFTCILNANASEFFSLAAPNFLILVMNFLRGVLRNPLWSPPTLFLLLFDTILDRVPSESCLERPLLLFYYFSILFQIGILQNILWSPPTDFYITLNGNS